MIDLYIISFHWSYILVFFIAANLGFILSGLLATGPTSELEMRLAKSRKRIDEQTQLIFEMRKQLVEAKGAASSEGLRADCLERLKNEMQTEYDELAKDYKDFVQDYKKLYIELDALKAAEARKFPSPEEIKMSLKIENDFNEVIKELTTIEEMLLEVKPKVLLAS